MGDFLAFRRMFAPVLIHVLFWLGVLGCLASGGAILGGFVDTQLATKDPSLPVLGMLDLSASRTKLILGIAIIVVGPIVWRLYCELLILPFRINGTLTDIRNSLRKQNGESDMGRPSGRR